MKIREGAVGSSTHRAVLAGELLDLLLGIFEEACCRRSLRSWVPCRWFVCVRRAREVAARRILVRAGIAGGSARRAAVDSRRN